MVRTGGADIYFPTDFAALRRAYRSMRAAAWKQGAREEAVGGGLEEAEEAGAEAVDAAVDAAVEVITPAEFLGRHAELHRTTCLSGYNPMVENYPNTRFFLS